MATACGHTTIRPTSKGSTSISYVASMNKGNSRVLRLQNVPGSYGFLE